MSDRIKDLASDASLCISLLMIPAGFIVTASSPSLGLALTALGSISLIANHYLDK